jgi:hypothetical protein
LKVLRMSSEREAKRQPLAASKVRVTERDLKILRALFDATVMSFEQLRLECFANLARVTAYNRVNELVVAGLIETLRVGNIVYQQNPRVIGNIYRTSRSGTKLLQSRFGVEQIARGDPFPWNTGQLAHDLILNDVGRLIHSAETGWRFKNGKHFASSLTDERRMPDALLQMPGSRECVAVELELTVKSEKRYREILLGYKLSPRTSRVLYVSSDPGVLRKVQSVLTGGKIPGAKLERSIGKFYFVAVPELMEPHGRELILSLVPKMESNTQEVRR